MASESHWRRAASRAIEQAIDRGRAEGLLGSELKTFVRRNGYPFGERANHPYKIWLSEMRRWFSPKSGFNSTSVPKTELYNNWLAEMKQAFAAGPTTSRAGRDP